ncbi:Serine protein kinase [Aspergillus mulundensis]|uniref:Serine protein kinase n=1 Tax=Aspergillus mulundensis TaxID=1810919 RepID=A0A3D8QNE4_9EURO|nr:Serine protein kinase [Aspergillus mulundensis]RDW63241.1 Serine protein kinase [Aspergillus mulundensis]
MSIQRQFPGVHWVWRGGMSYVYEVHPLIVVKVPRPGEDKKDRFREEVKIYELLSRHPPCPFLVHCFLYSEDGIFLEYMRDISLAYCKQFNMVRDPETRVVTSVRYMEPLPLRKRWMNDLAQGVAFLESLNLAHGDLRAENILLDRDRLKIADFDYTAEFGTDFETCPCPYARLLNSDEADQGAPGTAGVLGPRTEQFALGSLYYLINYGFELYDDQCLADDPYDHGPRVVDLLQQLSFPKLEGDPIIDDIIERCWHNQYRTIADLATDTEALLEQHTDEAPDAAGVVPGRDTALARIVRWLWDTLGAAQSINGQANASDESFSSKQEFCRDLEERGLPRLLASREPMELGFRMEHRHVSEQTTAS